MYEDGCEKDPATPAKEVTQAEYVVPAEEFYAELSKFLKSNCGNFKKDLIVGCIFCGDLATRGDLPLPLYPVWPVTAEVDAFSNRLMSASKAASFLVKVGPVSINSFVGTKGCRPAWAINATGALGTDGVVGLRGMEWDTCGVSLR